MNKLFVGAFIFLQIFMVLEDKSCRGNKTNKSSVNENVAPLIGSWGGEHIGLQITHDGAEIEFDCARGRINESVVLDKDGKFKLTGSFTPERGGPVKLDQPASVRPAEYSGAVKDKTMTLTVTLSDTREDAGTFSLVQDNPPQIMKCR